MTDLERFAPKPFISKLLGYGDMSGLIEHLQTITRESAGMKETQKHLAEGIFTIRDMKEQISNIVSWLGPLRSRRGRISWVDSDSSCSSLPAVLASSDIR
jgi:signal recognition particle subunit SRP54